MYIQIAPFTLKDGISEQELLAMSDKFEREFVSKQKGILKRILTKNTDGSYADIVFFQSKKDFENVLQAEMTTPEFFSLMNDLPGSGFDVLKTYGNEPNG